MKYIVSKFFLKIFDIETNFQLTEDCPSKYFSFAEHFVNYINLQYYNGKYQHVVLTTAKWLGLQTRIFHLEPN